MNLALVRAPGVQLPIETERTGERSYRQARGEMEGVSVLTGDGMLFLSLGVFRYLHW